jgi:hypothetical protein
VFLAQNEEEVRSRAAVEKVFCPTGRVSFLLLRTLMFLVEPVQVLGELGFMFMHSSIGLGGRGLVLASGGTALRSNVDNM